MTYALTAAASGLGRVADALEGGEGQALDEDLHAQIYVMSQRRSLIVLSRSALSRG